MGISSRPGLDSSIFRAYDIRGIYPAELNEAGAYVVAKAIQRYTGCKKVAIGRDARLSAPAIHQAICHGFSDVGCEVFDCGMAGTDMMSWAAGAKDFDVTISVTASHNPKEWIGMKIYSRGGNQIGGDGEVMAIGELTTAVAGEYVPAEVVTTRVDLLPDWIRHVLSFIDPAQIKPLKIVVDAGNGVAGPIVRELFRHLPVEMVEMYFEPDGNFPHHLPSPIEPKNVADLRQRVVAEKADLGMAFDGDADRMFLIDEQGKIVTGNETTAMVMDQLLDEDPSRIMLYGAIAGWNIRDVISKHQATAYRTKVGTGYIKKDMKARGVYFAGEHSGHYYFQRNYNGDSGLIAAVLVLALISQKGQPLSEILKPHRRYYQIPETNSRVNDPNVVMRKLSGQYADGQVDWLDGLTVTYPDWWFNVRPSSNEPLLRLNVEAVSPGLLESKSAELSASIRKSA
ncbi:phosphomannomutase/phosphoglucomutase [Patescibacteria group bacterium]|nr:phosphomannomutase/phosphoglucomutase [Patescibacteria group bacterium]